jgi:hypothetical protein
MVKKLKSDMVNETFTLEISRKELAEVIDSVNNMIDIQQRRLLENLPSEDDDRRKFDDYKGLREDLRKIWESVR